jgi:S1-C subfamily serine protease
MLEKITVYLKRTTLLLLGALLVWSAPHLKDAHYRYIVGQKVVKVIGSAGSGSGFHVKAPSGQLYILTNEHVCALADKNRELIVQTPKHFIKRKIVAVYSKHDLCLVEPIPGQKSGLELAGNLTIGEDIILVGHPSGRPLTLSKGEFISKGSIMLIDFKIKAAEGCSIKRGKWIEGGFFFPSVCLMPHSAFGISSPAYPGNSGSPVVNKWGNVVGVLFAGNQSQLNDSYMVPFQELKNFLKDY